MLINYLLQFMKICLDYLQAITFWQRLGLQCSSPSLWRLLILRCDGDDDNDYDDDDDDDDDDGDDDDEDCDDDP